MEDWESSDGYEGRAEVSDFEMFDVKSQSWVWRRLQGEKYGWESIVWSESLESDGLRRGGVIAQPFRLWQLKPVSVNAAPNTDQA